MVYICCYHDVDTPSLLKWDLVWSRDPELLHYSRTGNQNKELKNLFHYSAKLCHAVERLWKNSFLHRCDIPYEKEKKKQRNSNEECRDPKYTVQYSGNSPFLSFGTKEGRLFLLSSPGRRKVQRGFQSAYANILPIRLWCKPSLPSSLILVSTNTIIPYIPFLLLNFQRRKVLNAREQ